MACPRFIADYVGCCGGSDYPYIPGIDEMEQFCFTKKFSSCKLFKSNESKIETIAEKFTKTNIGLFLITGRYKQGSKNPINKLVTN